MPIWQEPRPKGIWGTTHQYKVVTVQISVVVSSCYSKAASTLRSVVVAQRKTGLDFLFCQRAQQLRAGAWTPGCSLPVILGYDGACKSPGKGPGSPPPPEASGPGCAASLRTDGCDFSAPVRCGSFHQQASGCGVRQVKDLLSCGCYSDFFGPAYERKYWLCVVFGFE